MNEAKRQATAGNLLIELLEKKLSLKPNDKDIIVMEFRITYKIQGRSQMLKRLLI